MTAGQLDDVEPARRDVGGDEHVGLALLERVERDHPVLLALVAVDGVGVDAFVLQLAREAARADLRVREDQHLLQLARADDVGDGRTLLVGRHRVEDLLHELGRRVATVDLDDDRVGLEALREPLDVVAERRGEQQVLPLRGQEVDDPLQVGQEAHVEHAVGLVEDEHLDLRQVQRLLLHVVEQAARRRDQHLDARPQRGGLRRHVDAAEDDGRAKVGVLRIARDVRRDLIGELAGRRQHQRADRMTRGRRAAVRQRQQVLQDRQRETGRLAGARLRRAHHVPSGHDDRDRPRLDRRRLRVALLGERPLDARIESEAREVHFGRRDGGRGFWCFGIGQRGQRRKEDKRGIIADRRRRCTRANAAVTRSSPAPRRSCRTTARDARVSRSAAATARGCRR